MSIFSNIFDGVKQAFNPNYWVQVLVGQVGSSKVASFIRGILKYGAGFATANGVKEVDYNSWIDITVKIAVPIAVGLIAQVFSNKEKELAK